MSWRSKLKTVGLFVAKNVLTLGVGLLVDRYASKKVAGAVKGVLEAAVNIKANQPPDLQLAIDLAIRDQVKPKFEAEMAEMRSHLGALLERNLADQAAALRGGKK